MKLIPLFSIPIGFFLIGLLIALSIDEPHSHTEHSIYYVPDGFNVNPVRVPVWICETDSTEVDLATGEHYESQVSRVLLR